MAPLRYTLKLDPFLSDMDCPPTASTLAQSKKKEGIKLCYLATLPPMVFYEARSNFGAGGDGKLRERGLEATATAAAAATGRLSLPAAACLSLRSAYINCAISHPDLEGERMRK